MYFKVGSRFCSVPVGKCDGYAPRCALLPPGTDGNSLLSARHTKQERESGDSQSQLEEIKIPLWWNDVKREERRKETCRFNTDPIQSWQPPRIHCIFFIIIKFITDSVRPKSYGAFPIYRSRTSLLYSTQLNSTLHTFFAFPLVVVPSSRPLRFFIPALARVYPCWASTKILEQTDSHSLVWEGSHMQQEV